MAPMGTKFGSSDGLSTERDRHYYALRAEGGVAAIVTEAMAVSEGGRAHNNNFWIYHDRSIPGLAKLVRAIKTRDCLTIGQLNHRGGLLRRMVLNMEPVGPSAWRNPNTGDAVRALDRAKSVSIQKDFVTAARRLWQAGCDAVELHATNGYLFHQFLTPRINRTRLLLETVHRIKDELPDFPLWVRLSCTEYCDDGHPTEDVVEVARLLEAAGVVALDLSGGANESPALSRFCIQPPSMPRRALEPYARPIKTAVGIPTILAGRIIAPEDAEAVLANGSADSINHLAVAAPDKEEVRPVWDYRWSRLPALGVALRCGINPTEAAIHDHRPDHVVVATGARPRPLALKGAAPLQTWNVIADPALVAAGARVAIIGGGIVGLEVADMLALRGCRVTVLEALPSLALSMARNNRIDLLIRLRAAAVTFHTKARVQHLAGTRLEFSVDGTPQSVEADLVIAAIGAIANRDVVSVVEAAGVSFTVVGDANHAGDFLTVLRDASMTGLALGLPNESLFA